MDIDDDNLLVLIEEWADMQSLRTHVGADIFKVVLAALDCASEEPEVRFDTVSDTRGMSFIDACRRHGGAGQAGRSGNASR